MMATTSLHMRATCLAIVLLTAKSFPISSSMTTNCRGRLSHRHQQNHQPAPTSTSTTLHQELRKESETDAQIRNRILEEIDSGLRPYTQDHIDLSEYGEDEDALALEDDADGAIDAATLGQWSDKDLEDKFDYEWDPDAGDSDPNDLDPQYEYVKEIPLDDEGNEVGYNPIFGYSNPIDTRTILNPPDSYVIDEKTRDDRLVPKDFVEGDPEVQANEDVTTLRKSLNEIETYTDEYLKMEVPRHTAKWHGYPEQLSYPKKDYMNNRFTKEEDRTDFDALGPARARMVAVQMARAKNNEWLPAGTSAAYHASKTAIYKEKGVITGSILPGKIDEKILTKIQPALDVLGDVVELLSIEVDTVFRFKYHGLMKNKRGMEAWAGVLIRNCDVDCTNVVFETGYRKRDPAYDGGDLWYGPY